MGPPAVLLLRRSKGSRAPAGQEGRHRRWILCTPAPTPLSCQNSHNTSSNIKLLRISRGGPQSIKPRVIPSEPGARVIAQVTCPGSQPRAWHLWGIQAVGNGKGISSRQPEGQIRPSVFPVLNLEYLQASVSCNPAQRLGLPPVPPSAHFTPSSFCLSPEALEFENLNEGRWREVQMALQERLTC